LTNPAFVQTPVRGRPSPTRCPDQRTWLRGRCPPGGPVRVPRTMLPGGRGPRRVAPVRRAGRSTVQLASEQATPAAGASGPNSRRSHRGRYHTDRLAAARPCHLAGRGARGPPIAGGDRSRRRRLPQPRLPPRGHGPPPGTVTDRQPRFVTPQARAAAGTTPAGSRRCHAADGQVPGGPAA
jgi:hypothetical protein